MGNLAYPVSDYMNDHDLIERHINSVVDERDCPQFTIDKVVYADNEDEYVDNYHVLLNGGVFGIVTNDLNEQTMFIRYVNSPLFQGASDPIYDDPSKEGNPIIAAAYDHWMQCNAASIA